MTKKFSYTFNYREELGSQQPSEIVVYREEHLLEPEDRFHGRRTELVSRIKTRLKNQQNE